MSGRDLGLASQITTAENTKDITEGVQELARINNKLLSKIATQLIKMTGILRAIRNNLIAIRVAILSYIKGLSKAGSSPREAAESSAAKSERLDKFKKERQVGELKGDKTDISNIERLEKDSDEAAKSIKGGGKNAKGMGGIMKGLSVKMFLLAMAVKLIGAFMSGLMTVLEPLTDLFSMFGEIIAAALMPIIMALVQAIMPLIPILLEMIQIFMPLIQTVAMIIVSFAPLISAIIKMSIVLNPAILSLIILTPLLVYLGTLIAVMIGAIGSLAEIIMGSLFIVLTSLTDKWYKLTQVSENLEKGFDALEDMANQVVKRLKQVKDVF